MQTNWSTLALRATDVMYDIDTATCGEDQRSFVESLLEPRNPTHCLPVSFRILIGVKQRMSTDSNAPRRMYAFVAAMFTAGIVIAGAYVVMAKPGESADKPVSDVVNPNG